MTGEKTYTIRKSFLIPFGTAVFLLTVLTVTAFVTGASLVERAVLVVLLAPAAFVLREAVTRRVTVGEREISLHRLFRHKTLLWSDITHVGCLLLRGKAYILLTTKKGFHIISNAYEGFSDLVGDILSHLPSGEIEVEAEAKKQAEEPARNVSDVVAAWAAVVVLAGIIVIKWVS
ncbi:MAG TPA: hypothetical protein PK836_02120 [Syntrophales bacterium]|nr:hypothetical protein [Syntrophales bacterium]HOM06059.1 hypothetical protein [Syntrophales bacterium]HON99077.1 hypothetical protein [Syntrophales bacterium]HPC00459.1 hypothetical protein [Syntrophales bacterium]HPQ05542.1 hypothetical protein [Syntrophales bacterium]